MTSTLLAFAILFALLFGGVPIGFAMAMVGVAGFAGIVGWSPAMNDAITTSSIENTKAIRYADRMDGMISGSITRRNIWMPEAPRSSARDAVSN